MTLRSPRGHSCWIALFLDRIPPLGKWSWFKKEQVLKLCSLLSSTHLVLWANSHIASTYPQGFLSLLLIVNQKSLLKEKKGREERTNDREVMEERGDSQNWNCQIKAIKVLSRLRNLVKFCFSKAYGYSKCYQSFLSMNILHSVTSSASNWFLVISR